MIYSKWGAVITLYVVVLSCFSADEDRYVVVHESVGVYHSVDELEHKASRRYKGSKVAFVLSQGERVKYVDDGYTMQFMYIRIETEGGQEGFILNARGVSIVEVE